MFKAVVFNVFIASPADVQKERKIFRRRIYRWNALFSEVRKIVLLPLGYETHSPSRFGIPPQETIDSYVLDKSDFLIAIFWSSIGSGATIDEIKKHVASGKPAALFFSNIPIPPDRSLGAQDVLKFKLENKGKTYYREFEDHSMLNDLIDHEINLFISDQVLSVEEISEKMEVIDPGKFSEKAREIITVLSQTSRPLRVQEFPEAFQIDSGEHMIYNANDRKEWANWKDAIKELEDSELIEFIKSISHGDIFELTKGGWDLAVVIEHHNYDI